MQQTVENAWAPGSTTTIAAMFFTSTAAFFLVLGIMDMVCRRRQIKRRTVLGRTITLDANEDEGWLQNSRSLHYRSLPVTPALLGDVERQAKRD